MKWGNINGLINLFIGLNKSNYRLEMFDVIFHHLSPESLRPPEVPPRFKSMAKTYVQETMRQRANCAMFSATNCLMTTLIFSDGQFPPDAAEKIITHLDDSVPWLKYLLSNSIPAKSTDRIRLADPTMVCDTLLKLLQASKTVEVHICASLSVVDYVVAAWSVKDSQKGECFTGFDTPGCPITVLFYKLMTNDDSSERVLSLLCIPGKRGRIIRTGIVEGVISRARQATNLPRRELEVALRGTGGATTAEGGPMVVIMARLQALLTIVERLCANPNMAAAFLESTFFADLVAALRTWLLINSGRGKDCMAHRHGFRILISMVLNLENLTGQYGHQYWKLCGDTSCKGPSE